VHQQEEDHGHKEKIMVSQTEDSRQAAAKGEEEQLAWHCKVHRQGQQAFFVWWQCSQQPREHSLPEQESYRE